MSPHQKPDEAATDEEILARLKDGERELFGLLMRRYERELFGYLRRYLGHDDLAADVFQNTFVALFVKIDQYQPGRPARPWLYTIATHQAIDALRRRNRRLDTRGDASGGSGGDPDDDARPALESQPGPGPGPPELAEGAEFRQQMRDAVDRLPELLKQVVLLAYFQGLRYQEIADALEIPLGTVKSRLHAALTKLGEVWEEGRAARGEGDERPG